MTEQIEKTENKVHYEFRKLGAVDVAPMCKIIGKIGINEFSKCFEAESVLSLLRGGKKENITDLAGIQVMLEVANIIITHIPEVEKDMFTLLASVSGLSVDEIKNLDFVTYTEMIINFVKKEEFKDFIGVVSKLFK